MMTEATIPQGYLRVTEVLEPFSKLHLLDPKVVKNAAERGSRVHEFCTMYALNLLVVDIDDDCKNYVESFIEWYDSAVEKLLYKPTRINSSKYRLSGEFDMIVQLKGDDKATLVDIKTPINESPSWQLQTAAYRMLVGDHSDICHAIDRRGVIKLPKDGSQAKWIEYNQHEMDEFLYLSALQLFRHFNG